MAASPSRPSRPSQEASPFIRFQPAAFNFPFLVFITRKAMLKLLLPPLQAICSLNINAFFFPFSKKPNYAGASVHRCRHFHELASLKPDSLIKNKCSSGHPSNT